MYDRMNEQIKKARENDERLLVMGDMNCKVGSIIKGNRKQVTEGGKC